MKSQLLAAAGAAGALAIAAALVSRSTSNTERANPPTGKFVEVHGVKLHYIDRGAGPAVVLLHGNAVSARDWESSGILSEIAASHRVIAFDRPGFGYSARPRGTVWTPKNQAQLIGAALIQLGIPSPVVVGHSWGTLVALELALSQPQYIERLVLLSGYYFPSWRLDTLLQVPLTSPVLGDVLRYTAAPVMGALLTGATVKKMFAPSEVAGRFWDLPWSMSLRPSQLRASAEDAVMMVPAAAQLQKRYGELSVPVDLVAGRGDKVVDPGAQSGRLARVIKRNSAAFVAGAGHMVHYFDTDRIVSIISQAPPSSVRETALAST